MINLKTILFTLMIFAFAVEAKVYDYSTGNSVELLNESRAAVDLKIEMIKKARHHVHIMTYYWDGKGYPIELIKELKKAHARGVDVRIITTFIPSLAMDLTRKAKRTLFSNNEINASPAAIAFLELSPTGGLSFTNNIHEKIFLVDGEAAIIGGRNISDNDHRAKDLEVLLKGPVVNQVQSHFEKMFSFMTQKKMKADCVNDDFKYDCEASFKRHLFSATDKNFFPEIAPVEGGVKARILTNEIFFQKQTSKYIGEEAFGAQDDIIDTVINTPFKQLRAYNYFVLPTERYKGYLETNLALGNKISMISNSLQTARFISDKGYLYGLPEMKNLVSRGLNLKQWTGAAKSGDDKLSYLHEKVMIFDEDHVIVGSHNFGSGSTSVSSEISVEFFSKDIATELIGIFEEEFNNTEITKPATMSMLERESLENAKTINFLHSNIIKNIVREGY